MAHALGTIVGWLAGLLAGWLVVWLDGWCVGASVSMSTLWDLDVELHGTVPSCMSVHAFILGACAEHFGMGAMVCE